MALLTAVLLSACSSAATSAPDPRTPLHSQSSSAASPTGAVDQNGWTRDDIKRIYGIDDPPTIAVVYTPSEETRSKVIEECLSGQGFVGNAEDGWSVPEAQMAALNLAMYICDSRYPLSPAEPPLTEDQRITLFTYWVEVQTPCLKQLGYKIPEPPTLEVWLTGTEEWAPYLFVNSDDSGKARTICPDQPADLYEK